jgi:2'-5' RNA ligase
MEKEFIKRDTATSFGIEAPFDYQLVMHLSGEAFDRVMLEKEYFLNVYKEKVAVKAPPHITLARIQAHERMEESMIRYTHRILSTQKSFTAILNNFSGFPQHTVYARVQDHEPFKKLAMALAPVDHYVKGNGCLPINFILHPHVTIARRLKPEVYQKAVWEYSKRTFFASFSITELVLLKRKHQFDQSKPINVFKLP